MLATGHSIRSPIVAPLFVSVAILLLLILISISAKAASTDEQPQLSNCSFKLKCEAECQEIVNQSTRARQSGEHRLAIDKLYSAYRLVPSCKILVNIVARHRDLGECEQAKKLTRFIMNCSPSSEVDFLLEKARTLELEQLLSLCPDQERRPQSYHESTTESINNDATHVETQTQRGAELQASVAEPKPASGATTNQVRKIPLYKRWWIWTIVGSVVLSGTAIGLGVGLTETADPLSGRGGASFPSDFRGGIYRLPP